MNLLMKSKPILKAPVPPRHYALTILPSVIAGLFFPNNKAAAPLLKSARPSIGRYSYFVRINIIPYSKFCH